MAFFIGPTMNSDQLLIHRCDLEREQLVHQVWSYARDHRNSLDSERHCKHISALVGLPVANQHREILRLQRKVKRLEKKLEVRDTQNPVRRTV